ncbi:MAG: aminotransferase class I/II-fold pyridoxal phosphate-dependent enzyme [Bacteroidia bacterium]|nr:aminotransferase class I/II-fold pyridoxal phosphate-dependent enzyme [Bacteroidia bacterium]
MKPKIWLSSPHMTGEEMKYINEAFSTNWVAPLGPNVDKFEKNLANYLSVKGGAALSSGTAAIHLALIVLGVKQGDEVICSSFTFAASANPIVYLGATPVFVDSEPETWNMDPVLLEEAIKDRTKSGKKPKAIIVVHLYGMPAKIIEIKAIASKYSVPLIEDAAEAIGSEYNNKKCGSFGDISILSFNGNKIITTSGGGALLSDNMEYVDHARFLSTQAADKAIHYQHSQIGYNYRMSNVLAGIGLGQLEVIGERVASRRKVFSRYFDTLSEIEGIKFNVEPDNNYKSNRWLTTIVIDSDLTDGTTREDIRLGLEKENIESRPLWKPLHIQPVFLSCPSYINDVSYNLFVNGLCLPSGSNLSDNDLNRVIECIFAMLKK